MWYSGRKVMGISKLLARILQYNKILSKMHFLLIRSRWRVNSISIRFIQSLKSTTVISYFILEHISNFNSLCSHCQLKVSIASHPFRVFLQCPTTDVILESSE